jgi:outer membrane protein assembly factor BamE (lipoprotein component of BamABCDE complex)
MLILFLSSCALFSQSRENVTDEKEITVGLIKKEIRVGLSGADVINILGSPNIITRDSKGKEVWVYDKIYAQAEWTSSSQYGTVLILGFFKETRKFKTSQKTLTLIITFDNEGKVESFSYHYSRF